MTFIRGGNTACAAFLLFSATQAAFGDAVNYLTLKAELYNIELQGGQIDYTSTAGGSVNNVTAGTTYSDPTAPGLTNATVQGTNMTLNPLTDTNLSVSALATGNLATGTVGVSGFPQLSSVGMYPPYSQAVASAQRNDVLTFQVAGANSSTVTNIGVTFTVDGTVTPGSYPSSNIETEYSFKFGDGIIDYVYDNASVSNPNQIVEDGFWVSNNIMSESPSSFIFSGVYALTGATVSLSIQELLSINCLGNASCDVSHTGAVSFTLPSNVTFTSASGVFLTQSVALPNTQVFPHVAADSLWQTDFVILNTSSAPVAFALKLHPDKGNTVPIAGGGAVSQVTGTVPANGTAFYTTDTTVDSDGWAELDSAAPLNGVAVFREANDQTSVLLSTPSTTFAIPFDSTAPPNAPSTAYVDGVAIANNNSNAAAISCQAYDGSGNTLGGSLTGLTVPAEGHTSFLLQQTAPFASLPSNTRGQLICNSTSAVSAVELRALGSQVSTMPVVTAGIGSTGGSASTQVFPHVAADTEWQTDFVILNTSSAPVTYTLTLHPDSGTGIPVAGMGSETQISGTVAAYGTAFYTTDATADSDGWAELQSNAPLSGVAVFRETNDQTSVQLSSAATNFTVPFDSTAPPNAPNTNYVDGLAIANSDGSNQASITCRAYDSDGNTLGGSLTGLSIPPLGHTAFVLQQTAPFTALPADTRGQLVCTSTTTVSAVELRGLGAQVSTMPVVVGP